MIAQLALFRRILRAHRKLPVEMRLLGDNYVVAEFRKHKDAPPQFVPAFMSEWSQYADYVEAQTVQRKLPDMALLGRELSAEELRALSDEQRVQLKTLQQEALSATTGN